MKSGDVLKVKLTKSNKETNTYNALVLSVDQNNPNNDSGVVHLISMENMHSMLVNLDDLGRYKSPNNKFEIEVIKVVEEMSTNTEVEVSQLKEGDELYLHINTYSKKSLSYDKKKVEVVINNGNGYITLWYDDDNHYFHFNKDDIAIGMKDYCVTLMYLSYD